MVMPDPEEGKKFLPQHHLVKDKSAYTYRMSRSVLERHAASRGFPRYHVRLRKRLTFFPLTFIPVI